VNGICTVKIVRMACVLEAGNFAPSIRELDNAQLSPTLLFTV
jgi:hypothetical protein